MKSILEQLKYAFSLIDSPVRGWMIVAVFGSVGIAALDTLGVAAMIPLMQVITGDVSSGAAGTISQITGITNPPTLVVLIAAVVATAFVLKSVCTIAFRWWLLGRTTRLGAVASSNLLQRYALAPYASHRQRRVGEIHRSLSSSVSQTFGQVAMGYIGILADVLNILMIGVVMLVVSPGAAGFIVLFFGGTMMLTQRILRSRHQSIGEEIAESDLHAWNALMPSVNSFRESRLTSSSTRFVNQYRSARLRSAEASRRLSLVSELPRYVLEIVFVVGVGSMAALLFAMNSGAEALSVLGVFAAAAMRLLPTLNRVMATLATIRSGQVGLRLLVDDLKVLDADGFHSEDPTSDVLYSGDVKLDQVEFHFPDSDDLVLKGITAVIPEGQSTAFVGSSGAGKSTVLDLVLGLLVPTSGSVLCGGRDIHEDLPTWFSTLGVVPQDVFLVDDTLAHNIAFGIDPEDVNPDLLADAIQRAQLDELVSGLPEGLDTRLGERGVRISGGQRQRVGIARALYRQPRYLVLDEATSALDNATEHRITQTIDALAGTVTVIVVAHRLSTVRHSDQVIFLSDGEVEAAGTFEDVRRLSPEFAHLVQLGRLDA